jgi:hypothetical protein
MPGKNLTPEIKIIENSRLAFLACKKLKSRQVAMVFGSRIHLYGVSRQSFLADNCWVQHELCHIRQFKQYGFLNFILKYLWESMKHGYHNNKYEVEARLAEKMIEKKFGNLS